MIEVQVVAHGSPEYAKAVELRREVLRKPLGLDFSSAQLAAEEKDTHLAILSDGIVVACLVLAPRGATVLQMRQFAVRKDRQGSGLGRRLAEDSEAWARENGFSRIVLHARETAVPFYLRLGYRIAGESFLEVGLPHLPMAKRL